MFIRRKRSIQRIADVLTGDCRLRRMPYALKNPRTRRRGVTAKRPYQSHLATRDRELASPPTTTTPQRQLERPDSDPLMPSDQPRRQLIERRRRLIEHRHPLSSKHLQANCSGDRDVTPSIGDQRARIVRQLTPQLPSATREVRTHRNSARRNAAFDTSDGQSHSAYDTARYSQRSSPHPHCVNLQRPSGRPVVPEV